MKRNRTTARSIRSSRILSAAIEGLESRTLLAAAGDLDPTFGSGGKTLTDFPNTSNDVIQQAALQADGKIIVLSGTAAGQARLARYTKDGLLDTNFGTGGSVTLAYRPGSFAVRSDDKIVVAGYASAANTDNVLLARYTAAGTVDTTFGGGDGQVVQPLFGGAGTFSETIVKVLNRPDDRILVAGSAETTQGTGQFDFAIQSFTEAGDIDPFFGDQYPGATTTDLGNNDTLTDIALSPDGHFVAVGAKTVSDSHHPFLQQDFAIVRYSQFGVPDTGFDTDGKLLVSFGNYPDPQSEPPYDSFDFATSVAVDFNEVITVAGISRNAVTNNPFLLALARINPNGTLDSTFDGDGKLTSNFASVTIPFSSPQVALVGGKIVVANTVAGANGNDFGITRLNANGSPDNTFGTSSRTKTDFGGDDVVTDLLIQDGKPVVFGGSASSTSSPTPNRAALARYLVAAPATAQTPFRNIPLDLTFSGSLQFEDFDNGGEGVAYHDLDAANLGGSTYRNTAVDLQVIPNSSGNNTLAFAKAGEWTEYTVSTATSGYYDLNLRYASLKGGGKFHLEIDGRPVTTTITLKSTGDWQKYAQLNLPPIDLAAGTHVIRLALDANDGTGYVGNFDSIYISRRIEDMSIPYNPNHSGWLPNQTIQAEDFNYGGEGIAYHDTDRANVGGAYRPGEGVDIEATGDVGGGYNVGYAKAGEWLGYTIETPQAGNYGLQIRAASLRAGGVFHVEIDGKNVSTFTAPLTGAWQTYTTISTPKNISLTSGQHAVRLVMDQNNSIGYVANFNWLKVVS